MTVLEGGGYVIACAQTSTPSPFVSIGVASYCQKDAHATMRHWRGGGIRPSKKVVVIDDGRRDVRRHIGGRQSKRRRGIRGVQTVAERKGPPSIPQTHDAAGRTPSRRSRLPAGGGEIRAIRFERNRSRPSFRAVLRYAASAATRGEGKNAGRREGIGQAERRRVKAGWTGLWKKPPLSGNKDDAPTKGFSTAPNASPAPSENSKQFDKYR